MRGQPESRTRRHSSRNLTERDHNVLADLWRFRYLTTVQLSRLHFGHLKLAQRRMRRLANLGLVGRFRAAEAAKSGFQMWCYHLAAKAHPLLAEDLGVRAEQVRHPVRPPHSIAFLRHQSVLTDFRIWLREGCRASAGVFGYHFVPAYEEVWQQGRRTRRVALPVIAHLHTLLPDGVFSLDRFDGRRALFCVEADRDTEPLCGRHRSAIEKKLLAYFAAFEARAERFYEPLFSHRFNGFRVLFLAPNETRAASLLDLTARVDLTPLVWVATHSLTTRSGRLGERAWQCEPGGPFHALEE